MMRSTYEQKEDIRLRMLDLEKKLAESEEERCKLEKTCDVLIRAFREQERMRYKVLNKKYEKFLEDCLVRSRRNDIILRSLCRIEDRSRTLFAKTERLKLLKDRYISYLKVNELRQEEASSHLLRNPPPRATDEVTTKAVRWKSPLALSPRTEEEFREAREDFFSRNDTVPGSFSVERYAREKEDEFPECKTQRNDPPKTFDVDFHLRDTTLDAKREEVVGGGNRITRETTSPKIDNRRQDKYLTDVSHPSAYGQGGESNESPKKVAGYSERECREPRYRISPENEDIKPNEMDPAPSKSLSKLLGNNHHVVTSSPKSSFRRDGDPQNKYSEDSDQVEGLSQEKDIPNGITPETEKTLPLGLDGIDYQNETYPESYYEQPVHHHNHTSIASDVILEEDETEQEPEDEEKNSSLDRFNPKEDGGTREQDRSRWSVVEPPMNYASDKESESPKSRGYLKSGGDIGDVFENVKSQEESESEKSSEARQSGIHSGKAKSSSSEKSEKSQTAGKSNLIHMLESDSESFQIEHGDGIPGNEDSDFDFSFGKN